MSGNRWVRALLGAGLAAGVLIWTGAGFGSGRAGADPQPWATNTVFAALDGNYGECSYDCGELGNIVAIAPGGGTQYLYTGEPYDVTVDPAGNLYWTDCNRAEVYEYQPGVGTTALLSLPESSCPTGIAYDASTDSLLIGKFYGIASYNLSTAQTTELLPDCCSDVQSIAVDGEGDIYFTGGSDQLFFMEGGAGQPQQIPLSDSPVSVRIAPDGTLVLGTGFGDAAAEFDPASDTVTPIGSTTQYSSGAAIDSAGDIFGSEGSYDGFIYEVSGDVQSTIASGLNGPSGLASWPPPAPSARGATSVSVSTTAPSSVYFGSSASFTATVTSSGATATGYVQFEDNGSPLGSIVPLSDGTASLANVELPAVSEGVDGTDDITALYLGDDADYPSLSPITPIAVNWYPDDVVLTGPANVVQQYKNVYVKVKVKPVVARGATSEGPVAGEVEVYSGGGSYLGSASLVNGAAKLKLGQLGEGSTSLYATYYPSDGSPYAEGDSNPISVTTGPLYESSLSGYAESGTTSAGETPVTAYVTVFGAADVSPTGDLTVVNPAWTCSSLVAWTDSESTATCTATIAGSGSKRVKVAYAGDDNYRRSVGTIDFYISRPGGGGGGDGGD